MPTHLLLNVRVARHAAIEVRHHHVLCALEEALHGVAVLGSVVKVLHVIFVQLVQATIPHATNSDLRR